MKRVLNVLCAAVGITAYPARRATADVSAGEIARSRYSRPRRVALRCAPRVRVQAERLLARVDNPTYAIELANRLTTRLVHCEAAQLSAVELVASSEPVARVEITHRLATVLTHVASWKQAALLNALRQVSHERRLELAGCLADLVAGMSNTAEWVDVLLGDIPEAVRGSRPAELSAGIERLAAVYAGLSLTQRQRLTAELRPLLGSYTLSSLGKHAFLALLAATPASRRAELAQCVGALRPTPELLLLLLAHDAPRRVLLAGVACQLATLPGFSAVPTADLVSALGGLEAPDGACLRASIEAAHLSCWVALPLLPYLETLAQQVPELLASMALGLSSSQQAVIEFLAGLPSAEAQALVAPMLLLADAASSPRDLCAALQSLPRASLLDCAQAARLILHWGCAAQEQATLAALAALPAQHRQGVAAALGAAYHGAPLDAARLIKTLGQGTVPQRGTVPDGASPQKVESQKVECPQFWEAPLSEASAIVEVTYPRFIDALELVLTLPSAERRATVNLHTRLCLFMKHPERLDVLSMLVQMPASEREPFVQACRAEDIFPSFSVVAGVFAQQANLARAQ